MGNERFTSALHAPARGQPLLCSPRKEKEKEGSEGPWACSVPAQRLAPSRAASPAPMSSVSPLCGVLGQQYPPSSSWAQPCLAVTVALWVYYRGDGFCLLF